MSEAEAAYIELAASPATESCAADGLEKLSTERAHRAELLVRSLEDDEVDEFTVRRLAKAVRVGREDEIARTFDSEIADGQGFAIARALKAAGYLEPADDVLADAIAANPDAELPDDLRALSDAGLHLAAAEALSQAGLDEQANEELELALKENPNLSVPDELKEPNRELTWWRSLAGAVGPWLRTIAEIVIVALAALALALVLALLIARMPGRFRVKLIIDPFTGGVNEKASGPDMTAAVRENYGRLRDQGGGAALKLVTSSGETSIALPPEVGVAYPQAALIAALIRFVDRLVPSRTRKAAGYLRPRDPVRGAGVTVSFGRRYGKTFDEITLWESDYGPLAPKDPIQPGYDGVAVPAATWLIYQAGERALRRRLPLDRVPLVRRLPSVWRFQILGVTRWRSYALFAVGAELQVRGNNYGARRRYLQALRYEPGNRGAMFNLAVVELLGAGAEGDGKERPRSRLDELQRTLEKATNDHKREKATNDHKREAMWYRVRYTQAVACLGPKPKTPTRQAPVDPAREAAVDLCATLLDQLDKFDNRHPFRRSRKELRDFLQSVRLRALVVLASALQEEGRPPRTEAPDADAQPGPLRAIVKRLGAIVAAVKRLLGMKSGKREQPPGRSLGDAIDPKVLTSQLKALADSQRKALAEKKPADPSVTAEFKRKVTHEAIVAYVIAECGSQEVAAAYNLACYFTRVERWSDAERYLQTAVELGGATVAEQARKDDALKPYLADDKRREKLEKLEAGLQDPEPKTAPDAPPKESSGTAAPA